jgi:hypothetical protein
MPSPRSQWSIFVDAMKNSPSLKGYAQVLGGKNKLAAAGAPPRIVLFPVHGVNERADDRTVAVSSGWLLITAHFWARDDGDGAFDLRERFFQALRAQADGTLTDPNGAGLFWELPAGQNERWDIEPDTAQQGQELEIDILVRLDALLPAQGTGLVNATSMERTAQLTADMTAVDITAAVDSAVELPTSGVLHIDGEMISYSGTTPTSFTGLVRGINGTTAAIHLSGATVSLSPT